MQNWKENLLEEEVSTIEKVPHHENFYTYWSHNGTHHLMNDEKEVCSGKEIIVFANGDYAVTKDYDNWTLYRDEDIICSGVWVNSHLNGSYTYKFYNKSFNKYVVRIINADGEYIDEIEGHENHITEQGDYNVM